MAAFGGGFGFVGIARVESIDNFSLIVENGEALW